MDPQHFTSDQEELAAYRKANLMKKIAREILEWFDQKIDNVNYLRAKQKGEIIQKRFNL